MQLRAQHSSILYWLVVQREKITLFPCFLCAISWHRSYICEWTVKDLQRNYCPNIQSKCLKHSCLTFPQDTKDCWAVHHKNFYDYEQYPVISASSEPKEASLWKSYICHNYCNQWHIYICPNAMKIMVVYLFLWILQWVSQILHLKNGLRWSHNSAILLKRKGYMMFEKYQTTARGFYCQVMLLISKFWQSQSKYFILKTNHSVTDS